jgi:superfamily II DNA or RNA helicase
MATPPEIKLRLRDYQAAADDRIDALEREGVPRILAVAPTGAGKTVLAAHAMGKRALRGLRCLFLAHRRELIYQTSRKIAQAGLRHGVILAGVEPNNRRRFPVDPIAPIQVAGVQTFVRRAGVDAKSGANGAFDFIVVDEAHHVRSDTYERILEANPCATVLGLTATPWRTDGKGLREVFDESFVVARFGDLIEQGALVPYRGFVYDAPELNGLATGDDGDFVDAELDKVMSKRVIVGNIVEQWAEHASDRRTVLFAASVQRSMEIVREISNLRRHGAPICQAEHIDCYTPANVRDALLDPDTGRLAAGETQFVSNVGLMTEGTDVPSIECIVLARPTLSTGLAMQCMGRGFRPSPMTGKVDVLIHDHAGVTLMHGLPDEDRDFSLAADAPRVKPGTRSSVVACKVCFEVMDRGARECWACLTRRAKPSGPRNVESSATIPLAPVVDPAKLAAWRTLLEKQAGERRPLGWAAKEFRTRFGSFPPRG